jgi:transposase InsO family protein
MYEVISELAFEGSQVVHLCDVLEVSRSAYYAWADGGPNLYQQQDLKLGPMVKDIFQQHRRRYGARRISHELKARGESCSRSKARKIMAQTQLIAIQPKSFKPRTTDSRHQLGYSPNLLKEGVSVERVNQVWVGDITYISLPSKFAYLAMLMDLFSRKIIGWSLDLNMQATLPMAALKSAIKQRQPQKDLIHHTDRGGQYAAGEYRQILKRSGMQQSMSRAGDCYDNAFMESCFGTIKTELEMDVYPDLESAFKEIQDYINYYNTLRRHSSINYLSPTSFELTLSP